MDNFKTICIYENLLVFEYFLINGKFCLVSLWNQTFSNIFPCARHVLISFELWTLCAHLYLFVAYFSFAPVISASIYRYVDYSDIQVLMMVTETETFNCRILINIYFHIYIYIYIYIYKHTCENEYTWPDSEL